MRTNYWSCSQFANWVRGTDKPYALSGSDWKKWRKETKAKHPFRYWIADTLLNKIQNTLLWPRDKLYSLKYHIVNRWIDQTNALVAHPKHIKPGDYVDYGNRILYCLFDELVDFVEIETAYSHIRWDEKKVKKKKWWQAGIWRLRTHRDPKAGLAYLDWASTLTNADFLPLEDKHEAKPTGQAISAVEIIELYKWWTELRPARLDPYDVSGWSEHCKDQRRRGIEFLEDDPLEDKFKTSEMIDLHTRIEAEYEAEDTEMLIRLIRIRQSLWT